MTLKDGDLVRIVRQPKDLLVQVEGQVGHIELLLRTSFGSYVVVHALHLDGRAAGSGTVPTDCVEPCDDEEWLAALAKNKELQEKTEAHVLGWNSQVLDAKDRIAKKLGIPLDLVVQVLTLWEQERPDNRSQKPT